MTKLNLVVMIPVLPIVVGTFVVMWLTALDMKLAGYLALALLIYMVTLGAYYGITDQKSGAVPS